MHPIAEGSFFHGTGRVLLVTGEELTFGKDGF
jgi:hypothetical protein